MARDVKVVQVVSKTAGVNLIFTAFVQANGGQYDNTEGTAKMLFANSGAAKTLTISTTKTTTDQAVTQANATFTIPATTTIAFELPAFANQFWGQPAGINNILVDVDTDTGLTWAISRPA